MRTLGRVALVVVLAALIALSFVLAGRDDGGGGSRSSAPGRGERVAPRGPIDPRQQTGLAFGERSHWLQPWRGHLETVPATRMLAAPGIQFNVTDPPAIAPTARLLRRSGFRRARVEIGWGLTEFGHPSRLQNPQALAAGLRALHDNGLRPLILLNANHVAPGPARHVTLKLARPVKAGDRTIVLDRASARQVVPRLTGFDLAGRRPAILITAVGRGGRARLARPSPGAVPSGVALPATTLRFEPFGRPRSTAGQPNRAFRRTLRGWLGYVRAVTALAANAVGPRGFDVEVWNEETFGSDFLHAERYYAPLPRRFAGRGSAERSILRATVGSIRSRRSPAPHAGVGDGFANQTPFASGATSPRGLTAIDKHPYKGALRFPDPTQFTDQRPVNALGQPEGVRVRGQWRDSFAPRYRTLFPEYYLTGIQTETLVRDLSPLTTDIDDVPHGRRTHPPGGAPPKVWITETNLDPSGAPLDRPGARRSVQRPGISGRALARFRAKVLMRTTAAYVSQGASAVYFYAALGRRLGFVPPTFPGWPGAGLPLDAMRRFMGAFRGAQRLQRRRHLRLISVTDHHDHVQLRGDGTREHPSLFDRDVIAFFPFQLSDRRFVIPIYVMTRDLGRELAPERFRIRVGGVDGRRVQVRLRDPLENRRIRVTVGHRSAGGVTIDLPATDSPRMLELVHG